MVLEVRAWVAHAVFAGILIGSLATRERAADPLDDSDSLLEPAIIRTAASRGLDFREYRTASGIASRTLVFEAPGCSQPIKVSVRLSTFEEAPLTKDALEPGYTRRYVYFDRGWDRPEPRAAFIQRIKYSALAMYGLTDYVPTRYLILVETPKSCRNVEAIDWRAIWKRDNPSSAEAAPAQ